MIKTILWDNDGVLVDTERLYFQATRQILATVDVELTREIFIEDFLVQSKGAWYPAEEKGVPSLVIDQLREERNALYGQLLCQQDVITDGVRDVLAALHGRYAQGVVTTSRRNHFELIHQRTGLLRFFDFVLTGDDCRRHKPDPEPYLLAVKRSGAQRQECIAIEDSERGLASALATEIECIVIPSELTGGGNFTGARKVVASIREVLSELENHDGSLSSITRGPEDGIECPH